MSSCDEGRLVPAVQRALSHKAAQQTSNDERRGFLISADELRRFEAKCNLLLAVGEDDRPLVRAFEEQAGVHLQEQRIRRVIKGAVGPLAVLLEEKTPVSSASQSILLPERVSRFVIGEERRSRKSIPEG